LPIVTSAFIFILTFIASLRERGSRVRAAWGESKALGSLCPSPCSARNSGISSNEKIMLLPTPRTGLPFRRGTLRLGKKKSRPSGESDAPRLGIPHARHDALLQAAYSKITDQAPPFRGQKSSKAHRRQEMASAALAYAGQNTLPSSFESDRRGNFPSPTGLPSTPRNPVSNINRIRPTYPLQTGLVQPWVQSESSCLASATPLNVRFIYCI